MRYEQSILGGAEEPVDFNMRNDQDYWSPTFGGLSFSSGCRDFDHDYRDRWDARGNGGLYQVSATFADPFPVLAWYMSDDGATQELFSFELTDLPDHSRLMQKRDRSLECRPRINAEIRSLIGRNLDRAFRATVAHHQGQDYRFVRPVLDIASDVRLMIRNIEVLTRVGPTAVLEDATDTSRTWVGEDATGAYVIEENGDYYFPASLWFVPHAGEVVFFTSVAEMEGARNVRFTTVDTGSHPELFRRIRK